MKKRDVILFSTVLLLTAFSNGLEEGHASMAGIAKEAQLESVTKQEEKLQHEAVVIFDKHEWDTPMYFRGSFRRGRHK